MKLYCYVGWGLLNKNVVLSEFDDDLRDWKKGDVLLASPSSEHSKQYFY